MRINLQSSHRLRWKLVVVLTMYLSMGILGAELSPAFAQSSVHITDSKKQTEQHEYLSRLGVSDEKSV